MLKDRNLFHGQSKIIDSPGPDYDNIVFFKANANFIACHGP